jgi:hypothetical protein
MEVGRIFKFFINIKNSSYYKLSFEPMIKSVACQLLYKNGFWSW